MKKLYIIGARGCGRETFHFFRQLQDVNKQYLDLECAGFLDDNIHALDDYPGYPPIVGSVEEFEPRTDDRFICALGNPKYVAHYSGIIEKKGGIFQSLICRNASISPNTIIGDGCQIPGWNVISSEVKIGRHVYIGVFCDIGHDVKIGDCCHIGSYAFFGGGAKIGKRVEIHPRVNILPKKKIGDDSVLGAGSVVIRNVAEGSSVFGVPALKIK